MPQNLCVGLAQINLLVGDIEGNVQRMVEAVRAARDAHHCDVVLFPELAVTGYPPEDLLLRADFIARAEAGLADLARGVSGIDVVVGHPHRGADGLHNAASLLRDGAVAATYHKYHLPNYGVFDEKRYFTPGTGACVVEVAGVRAGLTVCEDVWEEGPISAARAGGAQIVFNINASPYDITKGRAREAIVARRAAENGIPIAYVNLVGGQDELVFDGSSFVMDGKGRLMQQYAAFEEGIHAARFTVGRTVEPVPAVIPAPSSIEESVYRAITLGVRDYIEKNGFRGVVVGLSGGVDSALTLAIAADAIGPERVKAVLMPSRYTSTASVEDARAQADALGVAHTLVSIEPMYKAFLDGLAEEFAGRPADVTEENIQARCRGVILMAISNKERMMLLTTGNKSEMAVGYATLYGDMAGGYAAIKDVPKTMVYRLSRYRNAIAPVIPQRVLERPPSAELAPDQKDSDSLPPYDVLDPILELYIEQDLGPDEIIAAGFEAEVVERVIRLIDRNEYKRRQAAPGVRITRRAFGRDRRYPITSGFRRRQ